MAWPQASENTTPLNEEDTGEQSKDAPSGHGVANASAYTGFAAFLDDPDVRRCFSQVCSRPLNYSVSTLS